MSKVYIITGTSSGFGRALAEAVLERGDCAVVTARQTNNVADLVEKYGENALAVQLDVTNPDDREIVVRSAVERFGRMDVLINNAGQGSMGALEEFSSEQIRGLFEVNLFGVMEMTRAVLPTMREQRSGHIVNITSIGGLVGVGAYSLYCATKFAVEGFSEGLFDEVAPLGVNVTIVEPGSFRTKFAGDSNISPENPIEDYRQIIESVERYRDGSRGKQPGDPHKAALAIIQAVESEKPPLHLMLGVDAYGLWEKKRSKMDEDVAAWRELGENTTFEGA